MTKDLALANQYSKPIFVARQAVYNRDRKVWGYKLLFRHSEEATSADFKDPSLATARMIVDGFSLAQHGVKPDKKLFVHFPNDLFRRNAPVALPPDRCVVEMQNDMKPDEESINTCTNLREAGYKLAIGLPCYEPLLRQADIVKINTLGKDIGAIEKLALKIKPLKKILMAERLEEKRLYDATMAMGFHLFQGFLFSKPEVVPGRKISVSSATKLRLIHELSDENYEVSKLARTISSDISLSYRFLKFVNSAAFSLREKVKSLEHAVTMVGQKPLKHWLMAVTLFEISKDPTAEELVFISLQRGRFLELLGDAMEKPPFHPDILLLLGMFSLLDALLGQDMSVITSELPLEDEILAALKGEENEAHDWIYLAESVEKGDWSKVNTILSKHGLNAKDGAVKYNMASLWAQELLSTTQEAAEEVAS